MNSTVTGSFVENMYKNKFPLEKRKQDAIRVLERYPDRIPVVVECENTRHSKALLHNLDKQKYLVPKDLTVAQFLYILRRRCKIDSKTGLFIFFNKHLEPAGKFMGDVYLNHHDDDDRFLYATLGGESTFGLL
jgi:GABA(A) receptor-associated protein